MADVQELGKQGHESTVHSVDPSQVTRKLRYLVSDEQVEANAVAAVVAVRPATIVVDGVTLYPYTWPTERIGAKAWHIDVNYKAFEYPQVGEIEIEFDTDGGSARITQALSHLSDHAASGIAPNHGGAIGVTENGIEGTMVEIPAFSFVYHATFATSSFSQAYALVLGGMSKSVNSTTWHGFAAGTVQFRHARGRVKKGSTRTTLDYYFRFEPVDTARTDANGIALPDRNGHDVLWYSQKPVVDESSGFLVTRSTAAHIDRVYKYSDFSALGFSYNPWT